MAPRACAMSRPRGVGSEAAMTILRGGSVRVLNLHLIGLAKLGALGRQHAPQGEVVIVQGLEEEDRHVRLVYRLKRRAWRRSDRHVASSTTGRFWRDRP